MKKSDVFNSIIFVPILGCFFVFTALNSQGPDYYNYLLMIDRICAEDGLLSKVLSAKDPFFGFVVWLINPETKSSYYQVFLFLFFIVFVSRLILIKKLRFGFYPYIFIYIVFLSPGLDFAAVRALTGLSFLLIYLSLEKKYSFLLLLSVLSHLSMALPAFYLFKPVDFILKRVGYYRFLLCMFVCLFVFSGLISFIPQTQHYINEESSLFSIARGLILFAMLNFFLYRCKNSANQFTLSCVKLSIYLSVVSLGFVSFGLVMYRFFEMSVFVSLIGFFSANYNFYCNKLNLFTLFSFLIFIMICFTYRNIKSDIWYLIYDYDMTVITDYILLFF
ncbi:EpsG family protein [Aeromonas caviae]|uniref:EpsG family protein n=1 Tax=Aeromonas caviae TaxID=648 RepID=UPI0011628D37|nr:EpsG family protein [Aeromonas caviae]QDO76389.1 hypothetical protein FCM34_14440 [Aeromonas caviae]